MDLPLALPLILIGAVAASFIQGLSGFGFGLVAMSIWAWGVEPQLAIVLSVFGGLTGQITAAIALRRRMGWRVLGPFLIGGLAGIPIGIAILPLIDPYLFRIMLGTFLVLWCPFMLLANRLPPLCMDGHPLERLADGLIGLGGGILGGLGGLTGALPSLWCTLRQMGKERQRAIVQNFNLATLAGTMVAYSVSGTVKLHMLPTFGVLLPAILLPALLGSHLYVRMSEIAFRTLVLLLLTLAGITLLMSTLA